ncbi:hypothetical protein ABIA16_003592 [Sinorhizobium fredii]
MAGTEWVASWHRTHPSLLEKADQAAGSATFKEYHADRMTLSDLEEWYVLGGQCSKCQHKGWIDRWDVARRFGKRIYIMMIAPKLRCTVCGNKRGNSLQTGRLKR